MTSFKNDSYISQEKEGHLTLEDPKTRTPKLRWFVLTDHSLICFRSKDSLSKEWDIKIDVNTETKILESKDNQFETSTLNIVTQSKSINLYGSQIELEDWMYSIRSRIYLMKYSSYAKNIIQHIFKDDKKEIPYIQAIISFCIKFKCSDDIAKKFFSLLQFDDVYSNVSRSYFYPIIRRFQPLIPENESKPDGVNAYKVSEIVELMSQKWFSGFEDASQSEERLSNEEIGTYTVRFSSSYVGMFALCVKTKDGCDHFRIISDKNGYAIESNLYFPSVIELIEYYKTHILPVSEIVLSNPYGYHKAIYNNNSLNDMNIHKLDKRMSMRKLNRSLSSPPQVNIENEKTTANNTLQNSIIDFNNSIVKEKIGSGGSGMTVYRCNVNGLTCAVKVMERDSFSEEKVNHFIDEIETLKSVADCGHIVRYLHHIITDKKIRLFMEYFPTTLFDVIRSRRLLNKPFSPNEIIKISIEIIRGVYYLHSRNPPIIHRDIKSANVFMSIDSLEEKREVKLGDFGVSRFITENAHTFIGTPGYMAPEVVSSSSKYHMSKKGYTLAADIFAFGMVLYELLSLRLPYQKEKDVFEMVMKGKTPSLPALDESYNDLVNLHKECISYEPSKRPSAKEILKRLSLLSTT